MGPSFGLVALTLFPVSWNHYAVCDKMASLVFDFLFALLKTLHCTLDLDCCSACVWVSLYLFETPKPDVF